MSTKKRMIKRLQLVMLWFLVLAIPLVVAALQTPQNTMLRAQESGSYWSQPVNLSRTEEDKSVYVAVASDGGKTHIAWVEYGKEDADPSRILYTNGGIGSFSTPREVYRQAGRNSTPILALAVQGGKIHLLFTASNKQMRHVILTESSLTVVKEENLTPPGVSGYDPVLVAEPAGKIHAAWIDARTGAYQVHHRIWTNKGWESDRLVLYENTRQVTPSMVRTDDGKLHIAFRGDGGMRYAIYDGSSWKKQAVPSRGGINQVSLVSSGLTVHALWSNSEGGHSVFYSKGTDAHWSEMIRLDKDGVFDDYPFISYSTRSRKAVAVWTSGGSLVFSEIDDDGLATPQEPIAEGTNTNTRGIAGSRVLVAWQDKITGKEEIKTSSYTGSMDDTIVPPPPPPCRTLDIQGKCIEVDSSIGILETLPPGFIRNIFVVLLSLTGGVLILLIMYSGYMMMTSRGDEEQLKKAREILLAAFVGFLFVIFSFVVLEVIFVDILRLPGFAR